MKMNMKKQPIKKLRLYGMGHGKDRIELILGKDKNFFRLFGKLVGDPEFEYIIRVDKKRRLYQKERDITKIIDTKEKWGDIEILYGYKRIFITIFTNPKNKPKIIQEINEITK